MPNVVLTCEMEEETRPKIVTSHVYPPIPIRTMDWCAYRDGHEEDGNYGWGLTEQEAIRDLLDKERNASR